MIYQLLPLVFRTADALEYYVQRLNAELITHCYSESDRIANRRWTINVK